MDNFSKRFKITLKATPKAGLPVVTFAQGVSFHLNGDTLQVDHVTNAHTDGDALVYWRTANVIHMGDTFFHKMSFPFIDRESGGSVDGLIAAIKRGLALVRPGGKIIPGHGPVATREELQAYHDMIVDVREKVEAARRSGRSKAQVVASKPAAAYRLQGGFISADDFVATVFDSLETASSSPD